MTKPSEALLTSLGRLTSEPAVCVMVPRTTHARLVRKIAPSRKGDRARGIGPLVDLILNEWLDEHEDPE